MPLSRKNPKRKKSIRQVLNHQVRHGQRCAPEWRLDARTGKWKLPDWVSAVTAKLFPGKMEN